MEWIVKSLKPGGRSFLIVPDGILGDRHGPVGLTGSDGTIDRVHRLPDVRPYRRVEVGDEQEGHDEGEWHEHRSGGWPG